MSHLPVTRTTSPTARGSGLPSFSEGLLARRVDRTVQSMIAATAVEAEADRLAAQITKTRLANAASAVRTAAADSAALNTYANALAAGDVGLRATLAHYESLYTAGATAILTDLFHQYA